MKALVIDCAVSKLTVAAKNDYNTAKVSLDIGAKQSEKLLPMIDFVMKELSLSVEELDYTAVTLGPGTFTGLRLGLSSLKAINLSYGKPLYGIPTLEAYAWPYKKAIESTLSVIEAKEDEYYCQFFARGEKLTEVESLSIEEIIKKFDPESSVLVCGSGAKNFCDRVNEITPLYSVHAFTPEGDATESLFEIAERMISEKVPPLKDYDGPLYFRKSEAEIVLEKNKAKTEN